MSKDMLHPAKNSEVFCSCLENCHLRMFLTVTKWPHKLQKMRHSYLKIIMYQLNISWQSDFWVNVIDIIKPMTLELVNSCELYNISYNYINGFQNKIIAWLKVIPEKLKSKKASKNKKKHCKSNEKALQKHCKRNEIQL